MAIVGPDETPLVSIIIVNYRHPEVIDVCLRSLPITEGVPYEVVVVDNASTATTEQPLREHQEEGRITTLVTRAENFFFSGGNNLGVMSSNSASKYVLLLNSDVGFIRPDWLTKQIAWMEGTMKATPNIWGSHPTIPKPGPLDIVSIGWSHDANVECKVRPEGWCCLWRREWYRQFSSNYPHHGGFELAVSTAVREGARCGVLFNYAPYLIHLEGGSKDEESHNAIVAMTKEPDMKAWFKGINIETLDFTIGPYEHHTYMNW